MIAKKVQRRRSLTPKSSTPVADFTAKKVQASTSNVPDNEKGKEVSKGKNHILEKQVNLAGSRLSILANS